MKKILIILLLVCAANAQEIEYDKPNFKSIPLAKSYSDILDIYTWKDDLGKNTLIITSREGCGDGYDYCDLRAYHYTAENFHGVSQHHNRIYLLIIVISLKMISI